MKPLQIASVALVAFVLAGCGSQAAPDGAAMMPPPPPVSVAPVVARDVQRWDEFSGRIEAVETVELRPRVSGYIERVAYEEGEEVAEGDVLFVIDQRSYRAALAAAEAELARARTTAELAGSEAARAERLAEARAISTEERDQRVAAVRQAEAAVRAAEAAVRVARLDLEFTEVRSPIAGRAGRALVTRGNLVTTQPNATLLTTIVSIDPIHVVFEGDESTFLRHAEMARSGEHASPRQVETPVRVGLINEDGFPHEGIVDFIDNRLDPATGTIRARAVLDNAARVFTPGLFARVQLPASDPMPGILIDDRAVLTDQDRKYVYVLGPEDRAMRRDIVPGPVIDGLRLVEQGLAEGDRVIVHGVQKVFFPGMPVQPQEIAMGDDPPAPQAPPAP